MEQQPSTASSAEGKKRSSDSMSSEEKKQKKSRTTRIMTSQEAAVLVPQALLPLVETGFLATKDLGRLLLRTCKAMTVAGLGTDPDAVWKPLCKRYWGAKEAKTLLETLPMSPKSCFRQLAMMDDNNTIVFESLRPLQYTPQDYAFIVSVKEHETGKPILCKTIPGQEVAKFFKDGWASVTFKEPFFEKELDPGPPLDPFALLPLAVTTFQWDGTLHVLRLADQRMERFMKYEGRTDRVSILLDDNAEEEISVGWDAHGVHPLSIVMGRYGQALLKHYECNDTFEIDFRLDWRVSGINRVGIYGFDICARVRSSGEGSARSANSEPFWKVMEGKDVTLAHFLEAIME